MFSFGRIQLRRFFFSSILSLLILLFFFLISSAYSAQVTLAWDPNTDPDLAGYRIHYGLLSDQYSNSVDVGNRTSYTLSNLEDGKTYYLAATVYDQAGYESDFSNEVVYNAPPACTYSVSPSSQSSAPEGGTGTVNVTTQSGCNWTTLSNTSWLVVTSNGSVTGNGTVNYSASSNSSSSVRTATLTVAGQSVTVTQSGVPQYTLSITKAGTGSGTVANNPIGTTFSAGTVVTLTAAPDANSTFSGWSGGCTGTSLTSTITMNGNISVTATFTLKTTYTITLNINPAGGGSVSRNPDKATYTSGETLQLTATANSGYSFRSWSGLGSGDTSSGNVATITMNANKTVTANFTQNQNTMVTVQLKDSKGNALSGGIVQYYSNGWQVFGTTDASGRVSKELSPASYSFSMDYAFARQQKSQNVATSSTVVFQTTKITIELRDSANSLIDTGTVQYYSGGWRDIGTTSGGRVTKELLPLTYSFSMTYAFARQQKSQNVATSSTVVFKTGRVHSDSGSCTGYYAGSGWRMFIQDMELLPGTYTFRFNDGKPDKSYKIVTDTLNNIQ